MDGMQHAPPKCCTLLCTACSMPAPTCWLLPSDISSASHSRLSTRIASNLLQQSPECEKGFADVLGQAERADGLQCFIEPSCICCTCHYVNSLPMVLLRITGHLHFVCLQWLAGSIHYRHCIHTQKQPPNCLCIVNTCSIHSTRSTSPVHGCSGATWQHPV